MSPLILANLLKFRRGMALCALNNDSQGCTLTYPRWYRNLLALYISTQWQERQDYS